MRVHYQQLTEPIDNARHALLDRATKFISQWKSLTTRSRRLPRAIRSSQSTLP